MEMDDSDDSDSDYDEDEDGLVAEVIEGLEEACTAGDHTKMLHLLHGRPSVDVRIGKDCRTPLIMCAAGGHAPCVRLLLNRGADRDAQDNCLTSALMVASWCGHTACVQILLRCGADPTIEDDVEKTALIYAAEFGHLACLALLINGQSEVDARCDDGLTSLMWAAKIGDKACGEMLLTNGADVNAHDHMFRQSALWWAFDHAEFADMLLAHGAELEAVCVLSGTTPVMSAAESGFEPTVRLFIEAGAQLERIDRHGRTALMLAVKYQRMACCKLLLMGGASYCWDARHPQVDDDMRVALGGCVQEIENGASESYALMCREHRLPEDVAHLVLQHALPTSLLPLACRRL